MRKVLTRNQELKIKNRQLGATMVGIDIVDVSRMEGIEAIW